MSTSWQRKTQNKASKGCKDIILRKQNGNLWKNKLVQDASCGGSLFNTGGAGLARQLPCQLWSNWMGHHRKHCHHDRHRNHHRHRHHRHYHHRNHHRYHFAKITMQSIKVGRAVGESKKLKLGSKPRLRSIPALPEIANEEVSAKV